MQCYTSNTHTTHASVSHPTITLMVSLKGTSLLLKDAVKCVCSFVERGCTVLSFAAPEGAAKNNTNCCERCHFSQRGFGLKITSVRVEQKIHLRA